MMSEINAKPRSAQRKTIVSLLTGGIAGGLASFAALSLIGSGRLGELGTSREIAIMVAVVYLVSALAVAFGAVSPKLGARFLNVEDAEELREQKGKLVGSAAATASIGVALVIVALAAPIGPLAESVALALFLGLFALAWYLGARQQRESDEFMRQLSRDASAAAFYLLALIGGGWALIAHLGFVSAPLPLDWLSLFAGLLLIATLAACMQRGLMTPR
jgi:hypothetical protein